MLEVLEVLLLLDVMLNIASCWALTSMLSLVVLVKLVLVDTCKALADGSLCLVFMFNLLGRLMLLVILVRVLGNLGRLGMLIL